MIKKTILTGILVAVTLPLASVGLAGADVIPPSIETGDIFWAKNVTKNTNYTDPTNADACDVIQYRVRIHNAGQDEILKNVTVQASIPGGTSTQNIATVIVRASNAVPSTASDTSTVNISTAQRVTYINGSTQLLDNNGNFLNNLNDINSGAGASVGNVGISINEKRFVQFKANIGCPEPPKTPVYSCDAFNITANINRSVKVSTFSTTATNGAVFKNATVNWGDGSANLTDTNIIGKTHQYAKDGTYTISATANFTLNGQTVSASGPNCVKQVTFKGEVPPEVTPPPTTPPPTGKGPTTLVNTGPGQVAAIFAIVSAAGTVAYRWILTRRFGNL